jgi:predicted ATPase/serine/threonine protein kinase
VKMDINFDQLSTTDLPVRFDRYELMELLGEGGMGRVFRADLLGPSGFRKPVALKVITSVARADDQEARLQGLAEEARLAVGVRHPNLVDVYELREAEGHLFIVMELVDGLTLKELVERARDGIPPSILLDIGVAICDGLSAAHTTLRGGQKDGTVHCDLKLSNILVSWAGTVTVVDFGIAVTQSGSSEPSRLIRGTPVWMAPEQALGHPLGPPTDIFALGLVLASMSLGKNPLGDRSMLDRVADFGKLGDPLIDSDSLLRIERYCPGLAAVVVRSTAVAPEDRYATADELAKALLALGSELSEDLRLRSWMSQTIRAEEEASRSTEVHLGPISYLLTGDDQEEELLGNLERDRDVFVGRAEPFRTVLDDLDDGSRLITIHGVGGAGKTRLAREAAREVGQQWEGGTWFVDLSTARSVEGILFEVAHSLGVPLPPGEDTPFRIERIGCVLQALGPALLVLDNFEQIVGFAEETVGLWLQSSPKTRFIVTSRSPLKLPDERVLRLRPMPVDDGVALFLGRARELGAFWLNSESERSLVSKLVERLEGSPLAIELAAGRSADVPPTVLLGLLSERLDLLSDDAHTGSGRSQTLRSKIAWSWMLLSPEEQDALGRLSVFHGGFFMDAAGEVLDLAESGEGTLPIDRVGGLCEKSLLSFRLVGGRPRFAMLPTIQQFAAAQLDNATATYAHSTGGTPLDPARRARELHARWYGQLSTPLAIWGPTGRPGGLGVPELAVEFDNLIVGAEARAGDASALCALAIGRIAYSQGPAGDPLRLVRKLQQDDSIRPALRAALHLSEGRLLSNGGRTDELIQTLLRGLDLQPAHVLEAHQPPNRASSSVENEPLDTGPIWVELWRLLGRTQSIVGRDDEGLSSMSRALTLAETMKSEVLRAKTLWDLSLLLKANGDLPKALSALEEAIHLARRCSDPPLEGRISADMGNIYRLLGDHGKAQELLEFALRQLDSVPDSRILAITTGSLASVLLAQGKRQEAITHNERAIALLGSVGDLPTQSIYIHNMAIAYMQLGSFERAERDFRRAVSVQKDRGYPRFLANARANLGWTLGCLGRLDEGISKLRLALDYQQSSDPPVVPYYQSILALLLARSGQQEEALALLAQSDGQPDKRPGLAAIRGVRRAEVLLLAGQTLQAHETVKEAASRAIALNLSGTSYAVSEIARVRQAIEVAMTTGASAPPSDAE